jgi:hypothetical protein
MTSKLALALALFALGQMLAWFQINSQFVWKWWSDKPVITLLLYAVPTGLCFWYGMKLAYAEMNEIWGPRFLVFSVSYLTFPLLTWYFLNESMFTTKTMICVVLSFVIMGIQLFWR